MSPIKQPCLFPLCELIRQGTMKGKIPDYCGHCGPDHREIYPSSAAAARKLGTHTKPDLRGESTVALVAEKKAVSKPSKTTAVLSQDWADAEHAISAGTRRVLLHGIPGTGKTYAAQKFGVKGLGITTLYEIVRTEDDVFNVYLGEETAAYQIVGTDAIEHGTMIWRNGPGLLAWRRSFGRLIVNEIDHASGDTLDALMWLCDDEESARIVLPTGEHVKPSVHLQIVATMNGEPEDLPEAIQDRFSARFRITAPHPAAIEALPQELRKTAAELSHEGTPISQRVSIRQFRVFAEMIEKKVPRDTAARGAFHERADELLKTIGLAAA